MLSLENKKNENKRLKRKKNYNNDGKFKEDLVVVVILNCAKEVESQVEVYFKSLNCHVV